MVCVAALWPLRLWCTGRVPGLPIFPIYAATFLATFVFPFLEADQNMREYDPYPLVRAACTATCFISIGTLFWWYWATRRRSLPRRCLALEGSKGTDVLLLAIFMGTIYTLLDRAGWLRGLPTGAFTLLRSAVRGPVSFAVFVMGMRWGSGLLNLGQKSTFLILFITFCAVESSSLFLVGAILVGLMLALGFMLGRGRLPWLGISIGIAALSLLHLGKAEMRSRYWKEGEQGNLLAPQNYAAFFAEWLKVAFQNINLQKSGIDTETTSVFSRANIAYLLLLAQRVSPEEIPFLRGETYRIIPSALVPRLFSPEKQSPHYSTTLLNVRYERQTWETAQSTSIGWGLLNEAFANFGYVGCVVAAAIIGSFFGLVTWWCKGMPVDSIHYLVGIYTLGFAIQTEMTAAIFITAYVQGLFGVMVMAWHFTEPRKIIQEQAVSAASTGN
jgi:hypothetical protein